MSRHFSSAAGIASFETAPRGVTVRADERPERVQILIHNGCGRGNMIARLPKAQAIELALEIIRQAQR